ncbi:hypothetical protein B0T14DRAFT_571823 [Immersiella caudata]|uniref:Uncharacterized protein n=1 Tax=Immersiella caudata TaxID=314043 RepID=A0AA39WCX5_9PEZI|nr:hypothetical protein B0T14DRAFT_571823 [Immersiella caudata]
MAAPLRDQDAAALAATFDREAWLPKPLEVAEEILRGVLAKIEEPFPTPTTAPSLELSGNDEGGESNGNRYTEARFEVPAIIVSTPSVTPPLGARKGRHTGRARENPESYITRGTLNHADVQGRDYIIYAGPFGNRHYYVLRCDLMQGGTCHHFFKKPIQDERRAAIHLARPSPYEPRPPATTLNPTTASVRRMRCSPRLDRTVSFIGLYSSTLEGLILAIVSMPYPKGTQQCDTMNHNWALDNKR